VGRVERVAARWRPAVAAAVELLMPRACIVCGGGMASLDRGLACGGCWSRLPLLPKPWCARCGHPRRPGSASSDVGAPCTVCAELHPTVRVARSVCWLPHVGSSPLVAALKYQGWWGIADGMAERMVRTGRDVVAGLGSPWFVPVPLSSGRRRERGYNQSERLARGLATRTGGRVLDDTLVRERDTVSQTQLTPAERVVNVHGAFAVPASRHAALRGRVIVLVDDVLTTGATLNACAEALLEGGATDVRYWTFGRARAGADRP
jgi:ComF family protein